MINRIAEFVEHMNSKPGAAEGFPAPDLYQIGQTFDLTCKEVKDIFLGKEKAISRGRYLVTVSDEMLELAKAAPESKPNRAGRKTKAKRTKSTFVIEAQVVRDETKLAARRDLIANIASRFRNEDATIDDLVASSRQSGQEDPVDHERDVMEALESLQKSSTLNPAYN